MSVEEEKIQGGVQSLDLRNELNVFVSLQIAHVLHNVEYKVDSMFL